MPSSRATTSDSKLVAPTSPIGLAPNLVDSTALGAILAVLKSNSDSLASQAQQMAEINNKLDHISQLSIKVEECSSKIESLTLSQETASARISELTEETRNLRARADDLEAVNI
ncbi:hypothetical protein KPH14_012942, partial [Odynerus spinipes]